MTSDYTGLGAVDTLPAIQALSSPAPLCPCLSPHFFKEVPAQSYIVPSICTAGCALYPHETAEPEQNSLTCMMRGLP